MMPSIDLDRCAKCPVTEGACYPRRIGVRRLCEVWAYHDHIITWGSTGGPGGDPDPVGLSEWVELPELAKQAAKQCEHRKAERSITGCGCEVTMCRGGSRDGQVVGRIDCGRCRSALTTPGTHA